MNESILDILVEELEKLEVNDVPSTWSLFQVIRDPGVIYSICLQYQRDLLEEVKGEDIIEILRYKVHL